MVDSSTEKKVGLNYSVLLIEIQLNGVLPENIMFRNVKGYLIEQKVKYEWKPTLCFYCDKYGHGMEVCRKKNVTKKDTKVPAEEPKLESNMV